MKERRPYRMGARSVAAEDTARRLIAAMTRLFTERPFEAITIEDVAAEAGVTPQTLLRRFGSKAGLVAAAAMDVSGRVEAQRGLAPVGTPARAVANLFDHYEEWGELALRMVGQEERFPEIAALARSGRALHASWIERVFAPQLECHQGRRRVVRRAQLIATCDVTMWKLLRRDLELSRDDAEAAVVELVEALCAQGGA